jgi:hypothetical protein
MIGPAISRRRAKLLTHDSELRNNSLSALLQSSSSTLGHNTIFGHQKGADNNVSFYVVLSVLCQNRNSHTDTIDLLAGLTFGALLLF